VVDLAGAGCERKAAQISQRGAGSARRGASGAVVEEGDGHHAGVGVNAGLKLTSGVRRVFQAVIRINRKPERGQSVFVGIN
jgi:hypothetical protein